VQLQHYRRSSMVCEFPDSLFADSGRATLIQLDLLIRF
jgi:hypothetical protein